MDFNTGKSKTQNTQNGAPLGKRPEITKGKTLTETKKFPNQHKYLIQK